MHQPIYQDKESGEFMAPWVYLHTIKDYSDMAAHLEAHPNAKAVVNFAPVLLEQIEEYLTQIEHWRHGGRAIADPLLAALVTDELPAPATPAFLKLVQMCLRANPDRIIHRFPHFSKLANLAHYYCDKPEVQMYMGEQFLADLLVWYHLGWMGEIVRRNNTIVRGLMEKGHQFSRQDRLALMDVIVEIMADVCPRYRKLAAKGQVELAVSPYAHPMLPLLLNLESAREAQPDITLPHATHYPGGRERAEWHLQRAQQVFKKFFGVESKGCWSSEGGLSQPVLELLSAQGFHWTASGDSVLYNSLGKARAQDPEALQKQVNGDGRPHAAIRFGDISLPTFFRDDGLSDLIGFNYSDWHAEDAVGDLIHHLENIARSADRKQPCVISIIMDGENAWEYYPENGVYFLDELYRRLDAHPSLNLTTFSNALGDGNGEAVQLPEVVAGSWIYGTFSTWIGDEDKNRAWDLLCEAKQHFDEVLKSGVLSTEQVEEATAQLAICEGSDWFWWFGDYNPPDTVSEFEHLYRRHLANLYALIQRPAPPHLYQKISKGGGAPARGGAMRHGHSEQER
ncbi:glycoside hydrolase family 57 protein [Marinimicrobium sp. ABcell2]|uniref:glycoside hydrolase family 57 protein n=1 Tax=Marinimicrobium sp. ABcell2 TaxID=3069751 RepID=UPI0027B29000|nr:glycoside hydrolase family 57 protein [Marinimicrobium sp. ABcell2]MDQ2075313.1 glycoside hydrolase family 57 protein [Marinimicrobium sp. ABcell2]